MTNTSSTKNSTIDINQIVTDLNNKADKDLNNVEDITDSSVLNGVNTKRITNCLLEVPQRIKLELNNGVLTLKAGSKIIVPNGVGVFDEVTIESDVTASLTGTGKMFLCLNPNGDVSYYANTLSGSTAPTTTYTLWYDTANNIVKTTGAQGSSTGIIFTGCSLPFAKVTLTDGLVTSIDQTFNGLGYIGSTVWVDKGVKGLTARGRNKDGSLNNEEWITSSVITRTFPSNQNFNDAVIALNPNEPAVGYKIGMFGWQNFGYKEAENLNWNISSDVEWAYTPIVRAVITNGVISNFQPKLPFRAVDYNNKSEVISWSMPSVKVTNLTLGASNTMYTAPANGYFLLKKAASSTNQSITMIYGSMHYSQTSVYNGHALVVSCAAKKGDQVKIHYSAGGTTEFFRFVYAQGET